MSLVTPLRGPVKPKIIGLLERFQRNAREDSAYVTECKDLTRLAILEEQLTDVLRTLDQIKGVVR